MERKELAEHVKTRINVVEVVGRYVQLTRAGNNHKGLCPFHQEATPSFLVSEEKGIYKCFGCGEGGDAIGFYAKMEGLTYGDALLKLAPYAGVENHVVAKLNRHTAVNNVDKELALLKFVQGFYQFYLKQTDEGKQALAYLSARGMSTEIVHQFGIGLAPRDGTLLIKAIETNGHSFEIAKSIGVVGQNESGDYYSQFKSRIMFAVTNEQGHVVGFSGRIYQDADKDQAKYINSTESKVFQKSQLVYHLHEAKKTARMSGRLLLFEGFLDVIGAVGAGFTDAVATMGTALTPHHTKTIARYAREVILVFDGDKAGIAATAKAIPLLLLANLQVKVVLMPEGLDPDDFIKQKGKNQFTVLIDSAVGALDFQYEYLKQGLQLKNADSQVEFKRRITAFATQFPDANIKQVLLQKLDNEQQVNKRQPTTQGQTGQTNFYKKTTHSPVPSLMKKLTAEPAEVKAEKELIYYMLLSKDVFEVVSQTIGTSFNMDIHRKIVQGIEAYYASYEIMNQTAFLNELEPAMKQVAMNICLELKHRPKKWTKEMIVQLTKKVELGAQKLARAGQKEMFYRASHEQQLVMMSDLTAVRMH